MSFSSANTDIKTALSSVSAAAAPDLRNRETDIPAVVWALVDSNPAEHAGGSSAPYHARFDFDCLALSRIESENLADSVLAALASSSDWIHARETNRSGDVVIRGADKTPVYVTALSVSLTFGT
jgi:hypothetical protein